jgi:hypothetical protein
MGRDDWSEVRLDAATGRPVGTASESTDHVHR